MIKNARALGAGLLLLAGSFLASPASAHGGAAGPVVVEKLSRSLTDIAGKEVLMLTVEYPPGGADPVHRHDAHGFIYVLEGEIVMGVKGGRAVTLRPGDTFYEGPGDVHTIGRNASTTKPARFVVLLVKDANREPFIPVN
ncbi:cupin domain-containing protein [Streptococcus pyogenes]|uniref:cupin domain-containing protein n=1 Tax=Streptococcus pyogenes TaxID=1314 RepID=UPI003DA145CD